MRDEEGDEELQREDEEDEEVRRRQRLGLLREDSRAISCDLV